MKAPVRAASLLVCLAMAGCQSSSDRESSIGEAYVGPATLSIRQEIGPRSATVGIVHHGERLDIIQRRRRFLKVRTAKGIEGWTDERLLMGSAEVNNLHQLSADAKDFPSQGQATTYDTLNIHAEPQRLSPSYLQVKEGEKVDVIGHRIVPRVTPARKPLLPLASKIPKKAPRRVESKRIGPPPVPPPPGPPANWIELSRQSPAERTPKENTPEPEPVPDDDWTLVRTASGQSGWVLTRRLIMAIPDEVAQYAEGRRITSYFSLGKVPDGDKVKDIWLWTTIEKSLMPYDFDSFRVFIWNMRRHRYETALIQRKLIGYYPVLLEKVNGRSGFSVCVEKEEGEVSRRSYALVENLVKFVSEKPCVLPSALSADTSKQPVATRQPHEPPHPPTLAERFRSLRRKWFP